ncbi:ribose ABC transporter ATP-binding protein [Bacillus sp. AFS055030]|nr:ribose ABC transporter ATP-binding protein [Bacillus sp. AFS055030]
MSACNSASSSSSKKDKLTIALSAGPLNNPYHVAVAEGFKEAGKNMGAKVIVESAEYDLTKQLAQIESFITKRVDLIVIVAADSKGIAAGVQQAKDAGIPIVAIDTDAEGGVTSTITSDNYQAGKIAGEYIVKELGGKGNIVIVDGPPIQAVTDRIKGFEAALKNSNIKVIAKQNGEANREKSLSVMESILQANPKGSINAVFTINDPEAIGVEIAQSQANRLDDFFIVSVDGAPEAIKAMKKEGSSINATVAQSPRDMAKQAVEIGMKAIKGEKVEKVAKVPVKIVTQENSPSYKGW